MPIFFISCHNEVFYLTQSVSFVIMMSNAVVSRLREIDFLRGIAILLVLFRHQFVFHFTQRMGWIGVDLFFVLSGFLVSGLLFREYQKVGQIYPGRFLIRRGFKIYPIYYLLYPLYLGLIFRYGVFSGKGILADLFFVQNYVSGWGYAFTASWSLAVEEHFYVGFSLLLWLLIRQRWVVLNVNEKGFRFDYFIVLCMLGALVWRSWLNLGPFEVGFFTHTHLRIDSLLAGVWISYAYYFRKEFLENLYKNYISKYWVNTPLLLAFTPFIEPESSPFVLSIGFTMLYLAFGQVLVIFLMNPQINTQLDRWLGRRVVHWVSQIGFCSYSIYLIHMFVNIIFAKWGILTSPALLFVATSLCSIGLGYLLTYRIELYFLQIRDRYFPAIKHSLSKG
jgi:peptidoglycan/LPS O-acetylase OafA/YrhL